MRFICTGAKFPCNGALFLAVAGAQWTLHPSKNRLGASKLSGDRIKMFTCRFGLLSCAATGLVQGQVCPCSCGMSTQEVSSTIIAISRHSTYPSSIAGPVIRVMSQWSMSRALQHHLRGSVALIYTRFTSDTRSATEVARMLSNNITACQADLATTWIVHSTRLVLPDTCPLHSR